MWRIKDWETTFEAPLVSQRNAFTHWFSTPNDLNSSGLEALARYPVPLNSAYYGIFMYMVAIVSNLPYQWRCGALINDRGVPLTPEKIAAKCRTTLDFLLETIPKLEEIGWIYQSDAPVIPSSFKNGREEADNRKILPKVNPHGMQSREILPITDAQRRHRDAQRRHVTQTQTQTETQEQETHTPVHSEKTKKSTSVPFSLSTPSGERFFLDEHFDAIWQAYPKKRRQNQHEAMEEYQAIMIPAEDPFALQAEILNSLKGKFLSSVDWKKGFAPAIAKWLRNRSWKEEPESTDRPMPTEGWD